MKKLFIFICLFVLIPSVTFCQADLKQENHNLNTVFIQSDFLTWSEEFGLLSLTANYERFLKVTSGYLSFSAGGGPLIGIYDYSGIYSTIDFEFDGLFGRKHHFFEIGGGLKIFNGNNEIPGLLKSRIGYRLLVGQRVMFRISYELFLMPVEMGFSVGFGYRFGGGSKTK